MDVVALDAHGPARAAVAAVAGCGSELVLVWLQLGCALHCMLRPNLHFTAAPAPTTNLPQTPLKNRY